MPIALIIDFPGREREREEESASIGGGDGLGNFAGRGRSACIEGGKESLGSVGSLLSTLSASPCGRDV